jgi:hypothetical protein
MKDIRLLEQKSLTAVTLIGVDLATPTMGRLFNNFPSFKQYCQVFQTLVPGLFGSCVSSRLRRS